MTRNVSELQTAGGVVRGVLESLAPGTTYVVTVAGVNGASRDSGLGMMSSVEADTLSSESHLTFNTARLMVCMHVFFLACSPPSPSRGPTPTH